MTDSELLKREFQASLGISSKVLCIPHVNDTLAEKPKQDNRSVRVGVLSGTRVNKLLDNMASAIGLLLDGSKSQQPPIDCLFHTFGQRQKEVEEILANFDQSRLKIREEALDEETYSLDLASCDVVLLY